MAFDKTVERATTKIPAAYGYIAYVGILQEETQLLPDMSEEESQTLASSAIKALTKLHPPEPFG